MYFAGDEAFAGIAPDYEKSFLRCGVKDYEIKIREGMFHAWPVFTFTKEGREGEQEIIKDINAFFTNKRTEERPWQWNNARGYPNGCCGSSPA